MISIDENPQSINLKDQHGYTFKILLYIAIALTLFLISYLNAPRIYKKGVSAFLNLSFSWRETYWKIYNILVVFILLVAILLICKSPFLMISPSYASGSFC